MEFFFTSSKNTRWASLTIKILKRLEENKVCNISVGEGTVIPVSKGMVPDILILWETLESERIEIDVEEVIGRKINLFYGN